MEKQRKKLLISAMVLVMTIQLSAQGNGTAGINEATQMVTSYFDPATQLIYAIGAVVGLIGGVKVYNKFSSGDPVTGTDNQDFHRERRMQRSFDGSRFA